MNGNAEQPSWGKGFVPPEPGEEIVISGIAGRFPESDNVKMLQDNLFNKVDLITDDDRRWKLDHPEIPQRTGKINNVGKFDALFFGVHFKQAHTMDPMCRMLLEHTYEALIDAGVNPRQLRGTKTGVFIGSCFSESEKTWFYEKLQVNGFGITGCSRAMLANRISYWLGINGPSYTVDSACSSSLFAMEHAYRAIRSGQCDAAIVGGSNLCLHPYVSLQFSRLGVLSPDGRCKSFDADANGYTRSETVAVVFLQKAKDAKRIYATYIYGKTNCDGYKEQGITFPSSKMQSALLKEFYEDIRLSPTCLDFMEAHGTGTWVGDPEELNAIDKVFCVNRNKPLLIGSIKSNLGHSEPASGLCSIAKVVVAMESGIIPPNLHYKRPREGVKALETGRVKVVSEPTPWKGGYVGVNSFGFGGANAHLLLKSNPKEKVNNGLPTDGLPRLVAVSGRTEEAVKSLLDDIDSRPVDVEHVRLFHEVHADDIPGHVCRGYTIAKTDPGGTRLREIKSYLGTKKPVWFVFSGMGSQWPGMGEALMKFPVFARAVQKCDAVLKPRGVDIVDILTNKDKRTFDNILNSFVGIAAVQIGLVDLLASVGVVPDKIIGHSVGELGCAYADGCFTAEQMILSAYSRGLASIETKLIKGSMAAVGLGYEDVKELCPPDIEVACHNGPDSSTISGPAEAMRAFVAKLQANKVFAKEVPCSNIAYHSRYIAPAGPKLLAYLKQVIPEPLPRSQKWLSTSVPRSEWSTTSARLSSAEYHTNNLLSAVLFEETACLIPGDAITIEIAPHGLLQAILRRSMPPEVTNIALTQRGHADNAEVFLQGLGKLFNVGLQPQLKNLYPEVEFPVSRGTPMISPHIKWEHSDDWYVTSYRMQEKTTSGERQVEITMSDEDFEYMGGHVIDGRNLIPATGYLALVWETVGMMRGELYTEVSIVFEDVKFLRATTIAKDGKVELTIMVQKGTGRFEVVEGGAAVVTGMLRNVSNLAAEKVDRKLLEELEALEGEVEEEMSMKDIYKELRLRGYQYSGLFRGLNSASTDGKRGKIAWSKNWVAFMDNMLQMQILNIDSRGLYVPTGIRKLVIDTKYHLSQIRKLPEENTELPVRYYKDLDVLVSGGVEIRGAKASAIPRRKLAGEPVLEEYKFVAHRDRAQVTMREAVRISTHLALENRQTIKVKTVEVIDDDGDANLENLASPILLDVLGDLPLIQANVVIASSPDRFDESSLPENVTVVETKKLPSDNNALLAVGRGLLTDGKGETLQRVLTTLKDGGFLLTRETDTSVTDPHRVSKRGLDVVLEKRAGAEALVLLKKREKMAKNVVVIHARNDEFAWLDELRAVLNEEAESNYSDNKRVIVVGERDFESGVLGFVNCLRKEPGGEIIRGVLIQDENAPEFSLADPLYYEQLRADLAVNVLRPGRVWGSYRHLPLPALEPRPLPHCIVHQLVHGDLSALRWMEGPLRPEYLHEDCISVVYSSLNFRDIMFSTGKISPNVTGLARRFVECTVGFEYSGVDPQGRRIMGLIENRALANICEADRLLTWDVPSRWSLEDAATIPCVYATCYYAFYTNGSRIKKGDRILIHAGSGGVGQAAINLALFEGCEVFTTVGTPEKRKFIRETFPSIPDDHIGNSRDTSFEQMIMRMTHGRGVDYVLNSLAEEKLLASVRCLAPRGRFLEIGKFDLFADNTLGMMPFLKEISFHGVMLDNLFNTDSETKRQLRGLLTRGIESGAVKPLVRKVFGKDEIEAALRYMAAGKHIGKVMIKVRDEGAPLDKPITGYPRFYCSPDKSYVIVGGLGGFGMELADWMVLRGCKNLVLTSRTGVKNGYQRLRIRTWESYGATVVVIAGQDASTREGCEFILRAARKLGPVHAIFNLAVVLKDCLCRNQTQDNFVESFRAKAWTTKRLDELSRKLCPELRHFVVFSSVSCGRGNAGQTNYGMANSVMERICEQRAAAGLPGLAVQWGAVGDVGLVADMQEDNKELVIGGTLQQKIHSCLKELDGFMQQDRPVVSSMVVAEKRAGGAGANNIVGTVLNIMGVKDLSTMSEQTSLAELGMDSMMAVEIKQTLEREFEVFLTAQDIRNLNLAKLKEMAAKDEQENRRNRGAEDDADKMAGIRLLLRTIGADYDDTEICVQYPVKAEDDRSEVFFVPGVEGCSSVFDPVVSKIKCPATCLQMGSRAEDHESIASMANLLLPHVLNRSKDRRDFAIVGYSFGAVVAIELARSLEAEGLLGRLILVDGAPELMKAITEQHIPSATDEELQNNVLLGIMDILNPAVSVELVVALAKCKCWEERLETFLSYGPNEELSQEMTKMTVEKQRAMCTAIYKRLVALRAYFKTSLPPIRSPVTLLKPTSQTARGTSEDYGLRQVTRGKVDIYYIDGNHVSILDDNKIAAAINGDPLEDAADFKARIMEDGKILTPIFADEHHRS